MLGVNLANKTSKKHVSRKLKSSWRKHIDTTDVDQFLEEQRQDERVGTLEAKESGELFTEDVVVRPVETVQERRKRAALKTPRCLQALINTSKVEDPIAKRNIKKKKPVVTPVLPKIAVRSAQPVRTKRPIKVKTKQQVLKDLWEEENLPKELTSEWVTKEQLLYTLEHVGKPRILNQPYRMDTAHMVASQKKRIPREGTSYNPAIEDYLELKNEVVEQEKKILKKNAHLDRVVTKKFKKMTQEEKKQVYEQEMSEGLIKAEKSEEESDTEAPVTKVALGKRRKRTTETKQKAYRKRLYDAKVLKQELAKLKEINQIEEISEELNAAEQEAERKAVKRAAVAAAAAEADDMPLDFIEPQNLSGNLRTIKPLYNLMATGLPKVRKVSIFRNSRREIAQKKSRPRKKVRYVRRSHKETD